MRINALWRGHYYTQFPSPLLLIKLNKLSLEYFVPPLLPPLVINFSVFSFSLLPPPPRKFTKYFPLN